MKYTIITAASKSDLEAAVNKEIGLHATQFGNRCRPVGGVSVTKATEGDDGFDLNFLSNVWAQAIMEYDDTDG